VRLSTRLTLAFLAVAFVPAGAVLAFTWSSVEDRFVEEFRDRLDGVAEGIRANLEEIGLKLQRKVQALSESDPVERILVDMVRGNLNRRALVPEAGKWMKAWDLPLLSLMDGAGTVLSSGHLPARSGSKDEELLDIATQQEMKPAIREIQVLRAGRIENILAVVVGGRKSFNREEVLIVGGELLDGKFVADLENLSGAEIQIVDAHDGVIVGGETAPGGERRLWEAREGVTYRRIALPPGQVEQASAYLVAGISEGKLKAAQQRILIASVGAALAGVFISLLLGLLISKKILGPVSALVNGARRLAKGDLEHRVPLTTSGEIGELVESFNGMADDLVVYRRRLVRAERVAAWREIARRIAHEIKNPLSPIQMSIESLRKAHSSGHSAFEEIFEESTQAILEEVAALKKIVGEFSEFARLPKPTMVKQELNPVVESTVNLYSSEQGRQRLGYTPGNGLPPVDIDREQIGRVLANLLSNAFWAVGDDGMVQVVTARQGDRLLLRVEDNGRGMAPEVLERVFTPYFTTRQDGTGLGLAIVQRIVEDHGGTIEVESSEGNGTSVTVFLPIPA
jgi:two-component system nitrogen regulation sensor histidine kinase NtrY